MANKQKPVRRCRQPELSAMRDVEIPEGFSVLIRTVPDSSRRDLHDEAVRALANEIAAQRDPFTYFAQWVRSELDCCDPEAVEDAAALFSAYTAFCERLGVLVWHRLAFAAFGRAMSGAGLPSRRGGLRAGVRLVGSGDAKQAGKTTCDVSDWLRECCDLTDGAAREGATVLYEHFRQFCLDRGVNGERILKLTSWGLRMSAAGLCSVPNHSTGRKDRVGVRLKAAPSGGSDA